jgi:hypothetical protein
LKCWSSNSGSVGVRNAVGAARFNRRRCGAEAAGKRDYPGGVTRRGLFGMIAGLVVARKLPAARLAPAISEPGYQFQQQQLLTECLVRGAVEYQRAYNLQLSKQLEMLAFHPTAFALVWRPIKIEPLP